MSQQGLTKTLQGLVHRHGLSSILHCLAEMQDAPVQESFSIPRERSRKTERKLSAVDYVDNMTLPREKAEVMRHAAQRFEDGQFLTNTADIREFCRIHDVELGKSATRTSSIPRVFTFLAAMDTIKIAKILDERAFSGPARLAPIADAICNRSTDKSGAIMPARNNDIDNNEKRPVIG